MKNLLEIDELISEDIAIQRQRRATVEKQLEFINDQIDRLQRARDCEHDPAMKDSQRDHCPKCGYEWVR